MFTRTDLLDPVQEHAFGDADGTPDYVNSVSSKVIRCLFEGERAVAVGCNAGTKVQITALLDLLHLHLNGDGRFAGHPVRADAVAVILGGCTGWEVPDALGTLIGALDTSLRVRVLIADSGGVLTAAGRTSRELNLGDVTLYPRWPGLLADVGQGPPPLLARLADKVAEPSMRAYPMLTSGGWWSLRLEGLEVGQFRGDCGWLDVGKDGKLSTDDIPGRSAARRRWQHATGALTRLEVRAADPVSITRAATALTAFAAAYLRDPHAGGAPMKQNEHALESRILRAAVPITTTGATLHVIRPDPLVNWGSQFPCKWGREGPAHYLDAMLRDGRSPWAVEIKVHGGGGAGQYYRHAIAQAVLYREFIRAATPLAAWFTRHDLDQTACRAAVVVPELTGPQTRWAEPLRTLCDAFDVELIQLPHRYAALHEGWASP